MISITTRADKGSPLTNAEVDGNFTNLKAGVEGAASAIATEATARVAADAAVVTQIESQYGVADGVATLDMDGKLPDSQVRKYAYANLAAFPSIGAAGAIYIAQDTGKLYRWVSAGVYVELAPSPEEVQQYANLAAFPVTGEAATLYISADTGLVYRWNGSAYAPTGLQPIANNTVLGNVSGGSATPVALTRTQLRELVGVKAQFVAMTTPNQAIVLNADTSALHLLGPGAPNVTVDLGALNEGATLVVTSEVSTNPVTFSKPAANHYLQGTNGATASIALQLEQFCIYTFTNVNGKILAGKSLSNAVSFVSTFTPVPMTSLLNTGALHIPATIQRSITTNTSAGGNSRGIGAVDFQRVRGAAAQVASGQDSFLFPGDRNTASQTLATAGGYQTSVSGAYSFGYSMYGSVTGPRSFLLGGAAGTASGSNGGQLGGDGSSITSGYRAVGIGGGGNAATAQDSVYIGGYGANVNVQGAHATGAGYFSLWKQRLVHIAGEATTGATPKALISSSQGDAVFAGNVLRSAYTNATLLVSGRVLGVSGAEHKAMRFDAVLVKTGTTYTVGWQSFTVIDETAALTTASAAFVGSSFGWELRVTGIAATTINWVSETEALEQVR